MRERFARAWWQVFVAAMVMGAIVGMGIGVVAGAGIGGTAVTAGGRAVSNHRLAGTLSKHMADQRRGTGGGFSCTRYCLSLYPEVTGLTATMSVAGNGLDVVSKDLRRPSSQFTVALLARVGLFCGSDQHDFFPPQGYLCRHQSLYWMIEIAWSPYGSQSGRCVGVARAGADGQSVTLRPCGADARTLWIGDWRYGVAAPGHSRDCLQPGGYCPLMNGADFNFSSPFVLAVDTTSRAPADQLRIERLALAAGPEPGGTAVPFEEFSFTSRPS